jgi:hypothetical protein
MLERLPGGPFMGKIRGSHRRIRENIIKIREKIIRIRRNSRW